MAHAEVPAADTPDTRPLVIDWQAAAEGCDCCETDGCSDSDALPDGLLQRRVPVAPVTVALQSSATALPRDFTGAVHPTHDAGPPGNTKLHIQHASFRC